MYREANTNNSIIMNLGFGTVVHLRNDDDICALLQKVRSSLQKLRRISRDWRKRCFYRTLLCQSEKESIHIVHHYWFDRQELSVVRKNWRNGPKLRRQPRDDANNRICEVLRTAMSLKVFQKKTRSAVYTASSHWFSSSQDFRSGN